MALLIKNSKKTHEFIGLCLGLLADNRLVIEEIEYLRGWLRENPKVAGIYPIKGLFIRLCEMLDDDRIDEAEEKELFRYLYEMTGTGKDIGSDTVKDLPQLSSKIEFSEPTPPISFKEKEFFLAGTFIIGTVERLREIITEKGGSVSALLTSSTTYCVVGAMAEVTGDIPDELGQEINKYKEQDLRVLSEESWVDLIF
jgi:hypothetical protein